MISENENQYLSPEDLAERWQAIGNPNPAFYLNRLIKTMVRGLRLQGVDDATIKAALVNQMIEGSKGQSSETREHLAKIVPQAIDEAMLEDLADEQTVIDGAIRAMPLLHAFGVIDDPSLELPPEDGPRDQSDEPSPRRF